ncbi:MAG: HD domain-containing protein [Lachnospiraceae bacterium]|nr:HD domain-containing protein [Lachnospiraceae bacterium]
MRIRLPEKVRTILGQLAAHGYEGYAVGGCVRDSLLGRMPNDWDITTSASPTQVKELFSHTFDTGIEHGTVTVLLGTEGFEVTTYRIDGEYADSRHPREVRFTSSLREDLRRRDFTINAMAYSESAGLVDLFGGVQDLERGVIRCVGEAEERFGEDALRMLRAVRFSAQLGFEIEERTAAAIQKLAPALKRISAERVQAELVKLLESPHPDWLRKAWETGITAVVLPEFDRMMEQPQNNAHHIHSVGEHTLETLRQIPADKVLRLTMLIHDMGKTECVTQDEKGIYHFRGHAAYSASIGKKVMKRLKFDNETTARVSRLVANHSLYPEATPEGVRRSVRQIGEDLFPLFLEVKKADVLGQSPAVWQAKLAYLDQIRRLYEEILVRGDCLSLKRLAVTGNDLIRDGAKPGPELGKILETLLDEVLECPEKNEKEYLMARSRCLRNQENSCGSGKCCI